MRRAPPCNLGPLALLCWACLGCGGSDDAPDRRQIVPAIQTPAVTGPSFSFEQFRDRNRVLVLFAPKADHPRFMEQADLIGGRHSGFMERDLVRIDVVGDTAAADGVTLADGTARPIRRELNAPDDQFLVVLIGKDGTQKIRRTEPLGVDELYATIDAMPMRQREMRE
jgi:hypothetical protein